MIKALLILFVTAGSFIAYLNTSQPGYSQYRTTFTPAGCEWAEANGIKVKRDEKFCTGLLRLRPMSGGGLALLDDDREIRITAAAILTMERINQEMLGETQGQKDSAIREAVILVVMFLLIIVILAFPEKRNAERSREAGNE